MCSKLFWAVARNRLLLATPGYCERENLSTQHVVSRTSQLHKTIRQISKVQGELWLQLEQLQSSANPASDLCVLCAEALVENGGLVEREESGDGPGLVL